MYPRFFPGRAANIAHPLLYQTGLVLHSLPGFSTCCTVTALLVTTAIFARLGGRSRSLPPGAYQAVAARAARDCGEVAHLFTRSPEWSPVQAARTCLWPLSPGAGPLRTTADRTPEDPTHILLLLAKVARREGGRARRTGSSGAGDLPGQWRTRDLPVASQQPAGAAWGLDAARREVATRLQQPGGVGRTVFAHG